MNLIKHDELKKTHVSKDSHSPMNKELQKLLERAVKAETQADFLLAALQEIKVLAPFDKIYEIANTAIEGCNAK